jgi:hypothetical protein
MSRHRVRPATQGKTLPFLYSEVLLLNFFGLPKSEKGNCTNYVLGRAVSHQEKKLKENRDTASMTSGKCVCKNRNR